LKNILFFSVLNLDLNKKFLIVDARSYTAAWANRAKGGGFEGPGYIKFYLLSVTKPGCLQNSLKQETNCKISNLLFRYLP